MVLRGEFMNIQHFYDPATYTLTYVVSDERTKDALIIDPVLDFDPSSGRIEDKSTKPVIDYISTQGLKVRAILETHAHADHISSSQLLKKIYPEAILAIGERITIVQETFKKFLNLDYQETEGKVFDKLLKDFEEISFGSIKMKAIPTPGHTPACMSFLIEDALFSGDALFMPDSGTGRCDFPRGSAKTLYQSVKKNLFSLPDATRVFVGHDYQPEGRELAFETTIGASKKSNVHLTDGMTEDQFVNFREGRDQTLKVPRLLFPSIQVNINAGQLPPQEENGKPFLKIPLDVKLDLGNKL
jgi:glyoxylase-like metal-dependent hydrolase (beta-lactamase superfamily II)